jgi:hypothetical protein
VTRGRHGGRLAALVVLIATGPACGAVSGAPRLDDLRCADPDVCQSREDPFLLLLAVDFESVDGDLGAGSYSVYVDGDRVHGPSPLIAHFDAAGLSGDATFGTVVLPAGLSLSNIHSGMDFVVGIDVEDASGRRSNRPGIIFRLDFH